MNEISKNHLFPVFCVGGKSPPLFPFVPAHVGTCEPWAATAAGIGLFSGLPGEAPYEWGSFRGETGYVSSKDPTIQDEISFRWCVPSVLGSFGESFLSLFPRGFFGCCCFGNVFLGKDIPIEFCSEPKCYLRLCISFLGFTTIASLSCVTFACLLTCFYILVDLFKKFFYWFTMLY